MSPTRRWQKDLNQAEAQRKMEERDMTPPADPFMQDTDGDVDAEMRMFAILKEEEAIIAMEGAFTVNGTYSANNAPTLRFLEADRRVRERARQRDIALRAELNRRSA